MVLCTCPDETSAESIGRLLVEENLAACVNILPGCRSIYRWQGELKNECEAVLLIKTARRRLRDLGQRMAAVHPYDVPEVLALPVEQGSGAYLDWLAANLG